MPRTAPHPHTRRWLVAAVVCLVASLSACSTPTPDRTELVDTFERTGMSATDARCVSDAILDTLSEEQVAAIVERGPGGAPQDQAGETNGPAAKVREALTACEVAAKPTTTVATVPATDSSSLPPASAELNPASTTSTTTSTTTP